MRGKILLLSLLAILEGTITVKLICTHNDFSEIIFVYFLNQSNWLDSIPYMYEQHCSLHNFRKEVEKVRSTLRLTSVNAMFYLSTIPLVSAAMFIPYVVSGHTLTSEKVFTVVAIISSVNVVTSVFVPRSITAFKESGVSLHRIGVGSFFC